MNYIQVKWNHTFRNEPVWLYSELDDRQWEIRKIEIFPDGTFGYAGPNEAFGSTRLSIEPLPPLGEIASDPQFEPCETSREKFEELWAKRKSGGI
jgi:hypothetical protein